MDLTGRERADALRRLMLRAFVRLRLHRVRSGAYLPLGSIRSIAHGTAWAPLLSGFADTPSLKELADRRHRFSDEEFVELVSFLGAIALAEYAVSRSLSSPEIPGGTNVSN